MQGVFLSLLFHRWLSTHLSGQNMALLNARLKEKQGQAEYSRAMKYALRTRLEDEPRSVGLWEVSVQFNQAET